MNFGRVRMAANGNKCCRRVLIVTEKNYSKSTKANPIAKVGARGGTLRRRLNVAYKRFNAVDIVMKKKSQ